MTKDQLKLATLLAIAGAFMFFGLGYVHLFDWDEINFAECTREMLMTGDFLEVKINFEPFWEKPPFFMWTQAAMMSLFGINEFSARLPNAIIGIFTLFTLYKVGKAHISREFGLLWALGFCISLLPYLYFKSGILDPMFNYFIFLGFIYHIKYYENKLLINIIWSGTFLGLAILTKGPVALLIFGLTFLIVHLLQRFKYWPDFKALSLFTAALLLLGGTWFFFLLLTGKTQIISDFITYQIRLFTTEDAGHGGPFFYHWIVLLLGCFPISIFAIRHLFTWHSIHKELLSVWMLVSFWVVLLLFSIVQTKIVHYSSFCYFPLTYFAALSIRDFIYKKIGWSIWEKALFIFIAFLFTAITCIIVLIPIDTNYLLSLGIPLDLFTQEMLVHRLKWSPWLLLGALALFLSPFILFFSSKINRFNRFGITAIFIFLWMALGICYIIPNVENLSQKVCIDFYQEKSREGGLIQTIGFKSYAKYFYGNTDHPLKTDSLANPNYYPGKEIYLVGRIENKAEDQANFPNFKIIKSSGGFVFWQKISSNPSSVVPN